MISDHEFKKITDKMLQMEATYTDLIFKEVESLDCSLFETTDNLYSAIPEGSTRIKKGDSWGGNKVTGWFKCSYTVTPSTQGQKLYLCADTGALETLVFVNGKPHGVLANKVVIRTRGNHHALIITDGVKEGTTFDFALEAYCWHNEVGTQPFKDEPNGPFNANHPVVFNSVTIALRDEVIKEFAFSLRAVNEIAQFTRDDYKRAEAQNCLYDIYKTVSQVPLESGVDYPALKRALERMNLILKKKNLSDNYPTMYITGHSHLDTAWLWPIKETIRKAARTYSNAITMMKEYPEYTFLQSSACHADMMKKYYPTIFEDIKRMVAEGRWEPNGGVWIECDCNVTGPEAMVRQFLYGQRFTMKEFGYKSDTFWLPDTFGYSQSLPQIMKHSGVKNFCTTKMSWNDTNVFPWDTFNWQGIDGTAVLANLIDIQMGPTPKWAYTALYEKKRGTRISNLRYNSYGYGDGGAGPSYDLIELGRITEDIEGVPRVKYSSISSYMDRLRMEAYEIPNYRGEIYLELHRGTLTSQSEIKKGNRKAEEALHTLDAILATDMVNSNCHKVDMETLWKRLLINQFHDILPGTCISDVNLKAVKDLKELKSDVEKEIAKALNGNGELCVYNSSPFTMTDCILDREIEGLESITTLEGKKSYIPNANINSYSSKAISAFESVNTEMMLVDGLRVETPTLIIRFSPNGYIESLFDKEEQREVARSLGLDRIFLNEDVPQAWDNWDVDKDLIENLKPFAGEAKISLKEVTKSTVTFETVITLSEKSTLTKLIRIYSGKKQIDFETSINWHEKHKLLKAGFDLDINATGLRSEIQFGSIVRPVWKTNSFEEAKFEVSNQRWSDYSEPGYGAAILNDSKYGINALGNLVTLTLQKSGTHPDPRADEGVHSFKYSLLLHSAFSSDSVISKAYSFNTEPRVYRGKLIEAPVKVSSSHVVIESLKIAEDDNGLIIRLYECEGTGCHCSLKASFDAKAEIVNFLEEPQGGCDLNDLYFKAFEIKTIRLYRVGK